MLLEFFKRALWALFGVPALLAFGYLGDWWLFVPLACLALVGLAEYYSATMAGGHRPAVLLGYIAGVGIIAVTMFAPAHASGFSLAILAGLTAGSLLLVLRRGYKQTAVTSSAITVFGVTYVALLLSYMGRLRHFDLPAATGAGDLHDFWHRMGAVVLCLVSVWFSDTFAFLAGKTWGKRPLVPSISPAKTVEGATAGFLAAVFSALALGMWMGMAWHQALALCVVMGLAAQIGDMASSILKRCLGIKDFGTIFGVHGGFLDRFDGLLFVMPLVYYYLRLLLTVYG
jgi:phosphatidate cytidylyltransferase